MRLARFTALATLALALLGAAIVEPRHSPEGPLRKSFSDPARAAVARGRAR